MRSFSVALLIIAALHVGDFAPDFTLTDQNGVKVSLSASRGHKVVLVFYRGYWWPYCVRQLVGLRDLARAFPEVKFYAISRDVPSQSRSLASRIAADGRGALGFQLLSDPRSVTIDRYGLRDPEYRGEKIDGVPRPSVIVLDANGRIRWLKIETDYRERPTNEEVAAALDSVEN